jgi:hypothetical protein
LPSKSTVSAIFDVVEVGKTYVFQPVGKTQRFDPRVMTILDETELTFNE